MDQPRSIPLPLMVPSGFPTTMFGGYPDDPTQQQWVEGIGPNGERIFYNEKMNSWFALVFIKTGVNPDGTPQGYVTMVRHENNGGGSVVVPYTLVRNEEGMVVDILIAYRDEQRPLFVSQPGMKNFGLFGGFVDAGEAALQAARREHEEESNGVRVNEEDKPVLISERGAAINRAHDILLSEDEGLSVFAYRFGECKQQQLELGGAIIASFKDVVFNRDHLVRGCIADLIIWIIRTEQTAL